MTAEERQFIQQIFRDSIPAIADAVAERINARSEAKTDMAYFASLPPAERRAALKRRTK